MHIYMYNHFFSVNFLLIPVVTHAHAGAWWWKGADEISASHGDQWYTVWGLQRKRHSKFCVYVLGVEGQSVFWFTHETAKYAVIFHAHHYFFHNDMGNNFHNNFF